MAFTFHQMLMGEPGGRPSFGVERFREYARARLVFVATAILVDIIIAAALRNSPQIDYHVVKLFVGICVPLLALDAIVNAVALRLRPTARTWRWISIGALTVELGTSMAWVHVSGSITSYAIVLPISLVLMYRLGYDLWIGTYAAVLGMSAQLGLVILELTRWLRPAPMFTVPPLAAYSSAYYVLVAMVSIGSVYAWALLGANYVINQLRMKDVEIAAAREEARYGRFTGMIFVGRYHLGEVLGRGGMGEVYQARDEQARRACAVKVLHPNLVGNASALQRFRREAEVVSKLGSPHIVEVLETGVTDDGVPFLALELLRGEDLAQRLRRTGTFSPAELSRLAGQLAAGLTVAHAAGVIHRDLKPQNIFLCGDPAHFQAKILDFGVCKIREDAPALTATADIVGTPGFMAPEQVGAGGHGIDERTDVFALGAIFYRALTGVLPFGDGDLIRMLYRIANEPPALASRIRPDITPDVDAVLAMALATAPADRYPTPTALATDLAAAIQGQLSPASRGKAAPLLARASTVDLPEDTGAALAKTMAAATV